MPAFVPDFDLKRVTSVADLDIRVRILGVLEGVRQCFLHDPVGGQLDPYRQLATFAFDAQTDREASFGDLTDQRLKLSETWLGSERFLAVTS